MSRAVRLSVALLTVVALAACSRDDPAVDTSTAGASSTVPQTTAAAPTSTIVPTPGGSTVPGSPATSPGSPATSGQSATDGGPAVVEAGGWRLVVTHPAARATTGRVVRVCYEVSGPSREPDVAFDVTAVPRAGGGVPVRAAASVGGGSVDVDLGVPPGVYDLRIQLIDSGSAVDGAVVAVPGVAVVESPPAPTC